MEDVNVSRNYLGIVQCRKVNRAWKVLVRNGRFDPAGSTGNAIGGMGVEVRASAGKTEVTERKREREKGAVGQRVDKTGAGWNKGNVRMRKESLKERRKKDDMTFCII